MKKKKPYEPPRIVDLRVDYTQAVGQSRCLTGGQAYGQCQVGAQAQAQCGGGSQFSATPCSTGGSTAGCAMGGNATDCKLGSSG